MVAALRGAVGVAAVASALVGAEQPVSWMWLAPALAVVVCWTALYAMVAWTRGLGAVLVCVDLLLTAAMCLEIGKLMPAQAISGTLNWVSNITSVAVVSAQLAGFPIVSIPAGLAVTASYVAGQRLAHIGDSGLNSALILGAQTVFGAAVMAVAMRVERDALRAFDQLEVERTDAEVAAALREEERLEQGEIHNGPLTILAMALHADGDQLRTSLRQRAAVTRERLLQWGAAQAGGVYVRLDKRLAQPVFWYQESLRITTTFPPCSVAADVAEAFAESAAEAFENVVRHAGADHVHLELNEDGRSVKVKISDAGRGFDATRVPLSRLGLRKGIRERMAAVGGSATIISSPGAGTAVLLEWHRD